ncbi:MAG: glycosyltransferase [Bacteroidales bacterium]|nr:glycosyltransferase [Bacteroidales bacterium]
MSQGPDISVIVPIYNAEQYLPDCLDSILAQTFKGFEMILVNDGSTDSSGSICDEYARKDRRIRVIHKENGGTTTARREGIKAVTGRYIGWVDADDHIARHMYSTLYELAEENQAEIVECQYIWIKGNQRVRSGKEEPLAVGDGDFMMKQFFSSKMKSSFCTKLYRSELFDDVQFPDRQYHQDTHVNMRLALKPLKYVRTSEAMYFYVMRENSNTTTYNARLLRESIYKYEDTMNLARSGQSELARQYLQKDAISRLMWRYFELTVNSDIENQRVYNYYLRKKLGFSLIRYIFTAKIPFKTRVSLSLLIYNLKGIQLFMHKSLNKPGK